MWAAENLLGSDTTLSSEGYFVLNWDVDSSGTLALEQSTSPAFSDVIRREIVPSGALTITGLDNGEYYFRILANDAPLTEPLRITVQHHSLNRALGFFSLGLALFLLLIGTIVIGNRRNRV